jgi:preprotein translocase subunit SecF
MALWYEKEDCTMKPIDFMGKRFFFFGLSVLIIIVGLVSFFAKGYRVDISFTGGTELQYQVTSSTVDDSIAVSIVSTVSGGREVSTQTLSTISGLNSSETVHLLLIKIGGTTPLTTDQINEINAQMHQQYIVDGVDQVIGNAEVNTVEPSIGSELLFNAIKAVLISFLLIIIYLAIRFRVVSGVSMAIFSVVALLTDITVMFTVYGLFAIPINGSFVAAVLTVIGYSISDTIIVFDRFRENASMLKRLTPFEVVNHSIMQTLGRTINTSLTVIFSISCVYVLALINNISALTEFSFPLVIGIVSGTYSSILVAAPLWAMWKNRAIAKGLASGTTSGKTKKVTA